MATTLLGKVTQLEDLRKQLLTEKTNLLSVLKESGETPANLPSVDPIDTGLWRFLLEHSKPPREYARLQVESLLESGIEHLVRANALRQDGQEYGLRAINDFLAQWKTAQEVEIAAWQADTGSLHSHIASIKAFIESLERIHLPDRTGIERAELARAKLHLQSKIDEQSQLRAGVALTRLILAEYSNRNRQAGHALNHGERIDAIRAAFLFNAAEAFARLRAAAEGVPAAFRDSLKSIEFPSVDASTEVGYTNRLLVWARGLVAELERIRKFEVEYRLVLSRAKLVHGGNSRVFEVEVTPRHFPLMHDLRLRSLSVRIVPNAAFSLTNAQSYIESSQTFAGIVHLPEQGLLGSPGSSPMPNKLQLGDISSDVSTTRSLAARPVQNANPVGRWRIELDETSSRAKDAPPADILLELIVRATLA